MTARWYRGYGLLVRSEITLPEFAETPPDGAATVSVRLDREAAAQARPRAPDAEPESGDFVPAPSGGFVLDLPRIGAYWVRDGREIVVAPDPDAGPGLVRLCLLGSAFGMLLHQRGALVLHGATVAAGDGASIIVGDAGAGKSTLAAQLGQAGLTVLGDDTMAIWTSSGGAFELRQGSRVSKLWSDALESLGLARHGLEPVADRVEKFYVPNAGTAPDGPVPLKEIILLESHSGPPGIEPLGRLEALRAVAGHTYRPGYVRLLGREAEHFRQCAALAERVPVSRLLRPDGLGRADATVELLQHRWRRPATARSGVG